MFVKLETGAELAARRAKKAAKEEVSMKHRDRVVSAAREASHEGGGGVHEAS